MININPLKKSQKGKIYMQRVKLCAVILLILIALSVGSLWLISYNCNKLTLQIAEVQELYENREIPSALKKADELNRSWRSCYKLLSCLVKHDKLSEINSSIARIRPFLENDDDELNAEFGSILYQINLLRDTEFPYLHNIL